MKRKNRLLAIEGIVAAAVLFVLLIIMLPKFLLAQKNINTPIHFPDPIFRSIVTETLQVPLSTLLTKEDLAKFTGKLDCRQRNIKNLKGIEYLTSISVLDCSKNDLAELDISKNAALLKLFADFNRIQAIDLSHNPRLHVVGLTKNQLTELNVSNLPDLSTLYCGINQLTRLDLSKNVRLTALDCPGNQLTDLDLTAQYTLGTLNCHGNRLTAIRFHPKSPVANFYCERNQFQELNLSNLSRLSVLYCGHNQLSNLDISKNPGLVFINISYNNLTNVGCFLDHPHLQYADVRFNHLTYGNWDDLMKLKAQLESKPANDMKKLIESQEKKIFLEYSPQQGIDPFEKTN